MARIAKTYDERQEEFRKEMQASVEKRDESNSEYDSDEENYDAEDEYLAKMQGSRTLAPFKWTAKNEE